MVSTSHLFLFFNLEGIYTNSHLLKTTRIIALYLGEMWLADLKKSHLLRCFFVSIKSSNFLPAPPPHLRKKRWRWRPSEKRKRWKPSEKVEEGSTLHPGNMQIHRGGGRGECVAPEEHICGCHAKLGGSCPSPVFTVHQRCLIN